MRLFQSIWPHVLTPLLAIEMKDQASGITGILQIAIKNFYESDYLFNIVFIIIRFYIEFLNSNVFKNIIEIYNALHIISLYQFNRISRRRILLYFLHIVL